MAQSAAEEVASQVNIVSLTRFLLDEQRRHYPHAKGDFTFILQSIQLACKVISNAASKAGIAGMYGLAGSSNTSGDSVKKLDIFSDNCFINCMRHSTQIAIMVSEERPDPIIVEKNLSGNYAICFDPLDGSSNIDANVSVGTIFGVYRVDKTTPMTVSDVLRKGSELVAAGYSVYGAATMLVLTTGHGVNGFTLDPSLGEFILTHENLRIPEKGKIYSINEGNSSSWDPPTLAYIKKCKEPETGKPKSLRYIGSMVADVHRTLLYGGIFCYPADQKSPHGKLRLLYECNPMSFLMQAAGGYGSTGRMNILDIVPTEIHQRSPIFLGSKQDVLELEAEYKKYDAAREEEEEKKE